jgi:predicted helicase
MKDEPLATKSMVSEDENVSEAVIRSYLKKIEKAYQIGNATEHTYRAALQELFEALFSDITVTNEPKRVACGAPDLIVTHKQIPLGYIETKDINTSLDQTEHTNQMTRYLGSLANLILTDYVEFRWYVDGEKRLTARLAKAEGKGKLIAEHDGIEQISNLLLAFMVTQTPIASTPKELATRMASLAQLIRNAINLAFSSEEGGGSLHLQMQGFRQVLLPDLTYEQFADMYSQTICYGLFAARCNCNDKPNMHFTREHAVYDIPKTNPFLRKMFGYIAGADLDERIVWAVDDLAELLNRSDMDAILKDFGRRTRQEDPIVHFYETFLAEYNPKLRELRGVYYTPEPVVSYMVRSVDYLLKNDFGLEDGLADDTVIKTTTPDGKSGMQAHKVQILDPATGTGTFLHNIVDLIHESFNGNQGMWSSYVSEHLLPRLFGFELLMAPYAVAHMKLGIQLADTGYDFTGKGRLGVYLTNTLEEEFEVSKVLFAEWLVEEATAAGNVKYDAPVMVVIGNPPYSYESANTGEWISKLIRDYYQVDGHPLGERNPKALQDDYVKFIRFAQWRIERTGYGILAFITNHRYLENPTFPGMRQSLMRTFNEIYLLNLHGSNKPKETPPVGIADQNVFDIQQGVAIGIFVKHPNGEKQDCIVNYADVWGLRNEKYKWLSSNDIATTQWTKVFPQAPSYLFIPQDRNRAEEYERGWLLTEMMPVNSVGLYTARDNLAIQWTKAEVQAVLQDFVSLPVEAVREKYNLGLDSRDWQVTLAQKDVRASKLNEANIQQITYRPFDTRFTYYTGISRGLICMPRPEVMRNMLNSRNLAICFMRNSREQIVSNFFVANHIIDKTILSSADNANVAPLYIYPDAQTQNTLFTFNDPNPTSVGRTSNFTPAFIEQFANQLGLRFLPDDKGDLAETFGTEDLFSYMYAVFHSPTYRERYSEFLKKGFPRLPLTSNANLFRELCKLGERLVSLHLMEKNGQIATRYPIPGNNLVEKVDYTQSTDKPEDGRVWINKTQYIDDVPAEIWQFHVGGYQVCQKWLKDRKGRILSYDDIRHYQKIVAALAETINLMSQIDETIEEHGGWPIE